MINRSYFRTNIILLILLLLGLTSFSIIYTNNYYSKQSINTLVTSIIKKTSINIHSSLENYFSSSSKMLEQTNLHANNNLFESNEISWYINYLKNSIKNSSNYTSAYLASSDGDFIMVKRMPDKSISTKITNLDKEIHTKWIHENNIYKKEYVDNKIFDPRIRPWYKEAIKVNHSVTTDVYTFFSDKKPGITKSINLAKFANKDWVLGIDIALESLTSFLNTIYISENSKILILDEKNQVIAEQGMDIKKLPYPLINSKDELKKQLLNIENGIHDFVFDSKEYLASKTPIDMKKKNSWNILILTPKNDFLKVVDKNSIIAIVITSVLIMLFLAVGIYISQIISKDLVYISSELDKIKKFNLNSNSLKRSKIIEIDNINKSLILMKRALISFQKFVPSDLVKDLINLEKVAKLGGENKELTIMFTDIEKFTSISEKLVPEELVKNLETYFTLYSKVINRYNGTIDKYIGDCVMCFWGAPKDIDKQEFKACKAALMAISLEDKLMKKWILKNKEPFRTRIGIHKDKVIVGNMGSSHRFNYTVIGEGVNLASRLEALNKYYGTKIIVSETIFSKVKDDFIFRCLDYVKVVGSEKGIKIYELISFNKYSLDSKLEFINEYEKNFDLYLNKDFKEAKIGFDNLAKETNDVASHLISKRCETYLKDDKNFKVVYNWDTK